MTLAVGVVDYGMGNLHSVSKSMARLGTRVTVSDSRRRLERSDLLVLPGVGAFGAAMTTLAKKKLDDFVRAWIERGRPYLGICLGFQLLFEQSDESPRIPGLGVFPGRVTRFPERRMRSARLPVPHMGWNTLKRRPNGKDYFRGIRPSDRFYFVHSFYPVPERTDVVCTETDYGVRFCSSVATGRLFAGQFHPEKSGEIGHKLLSNIVRTARAARGGGRK